MRKALLCLKKNNPEYINIPINEQALNEYPEEEGEITGLPTIIDDATEDKMTENDGHAPTHNEELIQAANELDKDGDMPRPESIVPENHNRADIEEHIRKGLDELIKQRK